MRVPTLFAPGLIACPVLAVDVSWDASSGMLPDSVGFSLVDSAASPVSLVSDPDGDGVLIGPSDFGGVTYYSYDLDGLFSPDEPISLEVTVRIDDATYGNFSGFFRGGYEVFVVDAAGRFATAEIGPSGVTLRTTSGGAGSPEFSMDTTDGLHTYRVTLDGETTFLRVDGVEVLSAISSPTGSGGTSNAGFADGTILGSSTSITTRALLQYAEVPCAVADLAPPFEILDLADINAFVMFFLAHDPIADPNRDGLFDLTDVNLFVQSFTIGCPE